MTSYYSRLLSAKTTKGINDYYGWCKKFGELYIQHISRRLSVKVHILTTVSPMALEALEGFSGHLSEQVTEEIHNKVNIEAKNVMNTPNPAIRLENVAKVHI